MCSGQPCVPSGRRRRLLGEGLSCFLLLLLTSVQTAIDSTAQQCCSSARLAPKSMGLFSKLNLIQVRAPCPQAGPQLPSRASAHDAFVLRHPPPAPPSAAAWTPGAVGLRVSISLSTNRNEHSLSAGLEAGVKGFLPCLEFM